MATLTFDTLRFTRTLEKAGLPTAQAEAISTAFKDASGEAEIASKRDIERLEAKLDNAATSLRADMATLRADSVVVKAEMAVSKWMLGMLVAGVLSLVLKQFF